jgi:RNA polymerase sigma-70 factor (ECF subfamily)
MTPAGCHRLARGRNFFAPTRRNVGPRDDDEGVGNEPAPAGDLLALYDRALPQVYGYLRARCDSRAVAEDLTAETFLAAVDAVRRGDCAAVDVAWLIGVARHKLVDHWRRREREVRGLRIVASEPDRVTDDPWDAQLDALRAHEVLAGLGPHHRAALTLRYLDDLPVVAVADLLGRSLHATEALLVRARSAFRRAYADTGKESDRD